MKSKVTMHNLEVYENSLFSAKAHKPYDSKMYILLHLSIIKKYPWDDNRVANSQLKKSWRFFFLGGGSLRRTGLG